MVKNPPATQETQVPSLGWEDPWRRKWQPTPGFLPGKSHGQRSLAGYSPWGLKESGTTEATEQNSRTRIKSSFLVPAVMARAQKLGAVLL